jgi:Protein of unknown function (DUF2628)
MMSTDRHSAVTESHLQTFVGDNYEFYRAKWQKSADNNNNPMSWNWAAFFLGVVWLIYRKMYNYALIFVGLIALDMLIEWFYPLPVFMGNVVNLMIALAFGFYGNKLYQMHVHQKTGEIVSMTPPDRIDSELKAQGGVNAAAAWAVGLFLVALVVVVIWAVLTTEGV